MWLLLAVITGWFIYLKIAPSGRISYRSEAGRPGYFIGKLAPAERVETNGGQAIIKGDPAYFYLRAPRRFNQAKLTVTYKNLSGLPVVDAGLLIDKAAWRIDLRPLENKTIDQLALVWDMINDSGTILLQRQKKYGSLKEFINNLPERGQIAVYNYNLNSKYLLPNYQKQDRENFLNYPLRGEYQFYTYVKAEPLDYKFSLTDLSSNSGAKPLDLSVWRDDQAIYRRHFDKIEQRGEINLSLADLPEGVYKISVAAADDIVTDKIVYRQSKMSFINKIRLADGNNSNLRLWSDSSDLNVQTVNPAKLQTVSAGGNQVKIAKTYYQYNLKPGGKGQLITLEKDDLLLSGNGVFSFSQDGLIDFAVKKVDANLDINQAGINYVIANYSIPQEENSPPAPAGWKAAQAEFNLAGAYSEQTGIFGAKKYVFLISIPGLRAGEQANGRLELKEIKVDLAGASLWEKLRKFFSGL